MLTEGRNYGISYMLKTVYPLKLRFAGGIIIKKCSDIVVVVFGLFSAVYLADICKNIQEKTVDPLTPAPTHPSPNDLTPTPMTVLPPADRDLSQVVSGRLIIGL